MFIKGDYPKSYGSTKKNAYRLKDSFDPDIEKVESELWKLVTLIAERSKPIKEFKKYRWINSGWEWSVFRKNNNTVVKIPAEIFPEVESKKYLDNTQQAYEKILEYFPNKFAAETKFERVGKLNLIEQKLIQGKDNQKIGYNTRNILLLNNVKEFLECSLRMLTELEWLPDFDICRSVGGFRLRNVIVESSVPKIIDFTSYYDVYRLYLKRTLEEVENKKKEIIDFSSWIDQRVKSTQARR